MGSSVGYLPTIRISSGCKETRGSDNSLSFFVDTSLTTETTDEASPFHLHRTGGRERR